MNREEAIKILKSHYPTNEQVINESLEFLIPELKEDEDELTWLKNYISEEAYSLSMDIRDNEDRIILKKLQKSLAWLEKQGERKPADKIQIGKEYKCIASPRYSAFMTGKIYKPEDKFLCSFMNFCSDCFEPIEDSEQIDLASNTDKVEPKFKHGDRVRNKKSGLEQTLGSCIEDVYEGAFPFRIKDQDDWELVKQTPVDKVEPKFKVGDKIIEKDFDECGCGTIIVIKDGKYIFDDGSFIWIKEQDLWELVDEKSSDKVETKFKVGDWITDGHLHCKISEVLEDRYIVDTKFAKRSAITFEREHNYHLWMIDDAKDGDVLISSVNKPFIYDGYFDENIVGAYCGLYINGDFVMADKESYWTQNINIRPSTKEQRDLLFQKMKEAGYEWDAENKKLTSL